MEEKDRTSQQTNNEPTREKTEEIQDQDLDSARGGLRRKIEPAS